jgi:hypothetical protein
LNNVKQFLITVARCTSPGGKEGEGKGETERGGRGGVEEEKERERGRGREGEGERKSKSWESLCRRLLDLGSFVYTRASPV